jgi:hypothetical protein
MNPRLIKYLRSLGLAADADEARTDEFFRGLRGVQASIANALNYNEADQAARTNCDLMIRALGYDPESPNNLLAAEEPPQQRQQAGSDGASVNGDLERARVEGANAERQRRSAIEQYAAIAGCSDDFVRGLIDDAAITADVARERIFEDHRTRTRANVQQDMPSGPAIHSRNSVSGYTVETLEAAMLHRSGIDPTQGWVRGDANGVPSRARIAAADAARHADLAWQHRAASIEDMMRMAATLDRVTLPSGRNGLMRAYCEGLAARAFSTSALSSIFTTNMNSQLLGAFETAPDTTTGGWIRESDVADFKSNERARMKNGGTLDKLPRGSEANHASYEDLVESFKIARYAKQFVVDDQDIIDDTFGAINQHAPADLGVAARQLRPDLVYSILIGNPTMRDGNPLFDATNHGNYKASSGALASWLGSARTAMRLQAENGRNLNIMPKFLLLPPTLEDTGDTMLNSRLLITGASGTLPENNPNFNKGLVPVIEARLENGVTDPTDPTGATVHAGAADHWFLAAMAAAHTIEVAYLRGSGRVPQIRPFVLTQGRWGIGWDIKMDIGAKALSWEGLYRSEA